MNKLPSWTYEFKCLVCEQSFPIEKYDAGVCPHCGQRYTYDEGHGIALSEVQLEALRALRKAGGDSDDHDDESGD